MTSATLHVSCEVCGKALPRKEAKRCCVCRNLIHRQCGRLLFDKSGKSVLLCERCQQQQEEAYQTAL